MEQKGAFHYAKDSNGIFGITSGGGPHISIGWPSLITKMSFHFPQVLPLISDRSIWHNGKHLNFPIFRNLGQPREVHPKFGMKFQKMSIPFARCDRLAGTYHVAHIWSPYYDVLRHVGC